MENTGNAKVEHGATASTETSRVVDPARGDHYGKMAMQPLEFITANSLDFLCGNVVKYTTRGVFGDTYENRVRDLAKAKHYIELMIDREKDQLTFD